MAENDGTSSSTKKTKVSRPKPNHPSFFEMAKRAIAALAEKKGSSVPSIQTYIAANYHIDIDLVKIYLKPALAKGIEDQTFVRPKGSEAKGYTGRFKLNKVKEAEEAKLKAKKEKEKVKKEAAKTSPTKKITKKTIPSASKVKKSKSATKSPKKVVKKKTPTKAGAKSGTPKAKKRTPKAKSGTPKAKKALLKAKAETPKSKTPKPKAGLKTPKTLKQTATKKKAK